MSMPPVAYLLTFSTYGTHLPGSGKGWVDAQRSVPGSPMLTHNRRREEYWRSHLKETPFLLDSIAREIALQVITEVCSHRGWDMHAIHIRTTHVHAVLSSNVAPERMLSDCKAYATRALRSQIDGIQRRRYLAHHGSTRYLWNETSLNAAIQYVLEEQGEKMAHYPKTDS